MFERSLKTGHRATGLIRRRRVGFSIIELLVAIIIIGILVAVLLPVVSNRTEQARIARVNSDLENLGESMERVAIDTGYYVRLFALNDVLRGDDLPFGDANDRYDGFTDYFSGNGDPFIRFPTINSLFIDTRTGAFASVNRDEVISRLLRSETAFDGAVAWNGPYMTWQKDTDNFNFPNLEKDSLPDDPWGNNYILFTRLGMILEPDGTLEQAGVTQLATGGFSTGAQFPTQVFDRPTIVSLGPNGQPGAGSTAAQDSAPGDNGGGDFGDDDDYYRQFGR